MRIPRKLKIKDKTWQIKTKANLEHESESVEGLCDFQERKIYIEKGMSHDKSALALLHEFLHASLHENHISLDRHFEETIVDALSTAILDSFDVTVKFRPKKKKI